MCALSHLLIVDDLILHYRSVGSLRTLPGQSHAVLAPPLLQHNAHCSTTESKRGESMSNKEVQFSENVGKQNMKKEAEEAGCGGVE